MTEPILVHDAVPASDLLFSDMDVLREIYEVGGYTCDGDTGATVWRPDAEGKFPMIAFGHGYGGGGENMYKSWEMMAQVANAGYIVVANMSATITLGCDDGMSLDQTRVIEWAKDSSLPIDWDAGVGLLGYSMGAQGTHATATNLWQLDNYDDLGIAAGMTMHAGGLTMDQAPTKIPMLYAHGNDDAAYLAKTGLLTDEVWNQIAEPKVLAIAQALTHSGNAGSDSPWNTTAINWFNCMIKKDDAACNWIWGTQADSLCYSGEPYLEICKAQDASRGAAIETSQPRYDEDPDYVPEESESEEEASGFIGKKPSGQDASKPSGPPSDWKPPSGPPAGGPPAGGPPASAPPATWKDDLDAHIATLDGEGKKAFFALDQAGKMDAVYA